MDIKPRPHHRIHLDVLRRMTPAQRLAQACALSDLTKSLLRSGLRRRFPGLSEGELHTRFLGQLAKCYNKNY